MADEIGEIRSRIDIVELVGQRVSLKQAGKHWKGLCPFHDDKNPSFNVSPSLGRYTCWSCGEKGDIFTWVMKTQNVEFPEALRILAERAGVELSGRGRTEDRSQRTVQLSAMNEALQFFKDALAKSSEAKSYLQRRDIDAGTLATWELGYAPDVGEALAVHLQKKGFSLAMCKELFLVDQDPSGGFFDKFRGRLMFPIRDEKGDLVAFGGRVLGDGIPKYINSSDTPLYRKSKVLYGMHRSKEAMGKSRRAVLVEGYLDVIACHRAGVAGSVASLGTSMSEMHAKLLKRWCDEVVILYDSDTAGQKAADRASEMLLTEGLRVRIALMPQGEDPDTLLRTAGAAAVQKSVEGGITPLEYKLQSIQHRLSPEDEQFWEETVAALASAPTHMEMDRWVVKLAPLYPDMRDQVQAQRALRAEVSKRRRANQNPTAQAAAARASGPRIKSELRPLEAALFRAFLEEPLRQQAWEALREEGLLVTRAAQALALAVTTAFESAPPSGLPAAWLGQIDSESAKSDLADLGMTSIHRPNSEFLADAVRRLREERESRAIERLRQEVLDDDGLRDLSQRLRRRHGE